jgi:hypothetical protein
MGNEAPVNVKLQEPTIEIEGWDEDAQKWLTINKDAQGHPGFYPLTVKAAYVIGVVHTLCESVSVLLKDPQTKLVTYLPAYGVFASGIELLGRCINGNSTTFDNTKDLKAGFRWLAASCFESYRNSYENVPDELVLVQTSKYMYAISNLVALRHFAAHGQATSREVAKNSYAFGYIDYEILEQFPPLLADGLELYWHELQSSDVLCNNLAKADIIALRKLPVFLSWSLFEKDSEGVYHSIAEIFRRFSWKV